MPLGEHLGVLVLPHLHMVTSHCTHPFRLALLYLALSRSRASLVGTYMFVAAMVVVVSRAAQV
jgi:hypothetical protein